MGIRCGVTNCGGSILDGVCILCAHEYQAAPYSRDARVSRLIDQVETWLKQVDRKKADKPKLLRCGHGEEFIAWNGHGEHRKRICRFCESERQRLYRQRKKVR
jgi:hypothetical protein